MIVACVEMDLRDPEGRTDSLVASPRLWCVIKLGLRNTGI